MKHPNRFHSNSSKPTGKKFHLSGELILCLLICIISLLALTKYMNTARDHSPSVYTPPDNNHQTQRMSLLTEPSVKRHVKHLDIHGEREANEKLTFYVPNFHSKVNYEFDLGNGKTLTATDETASYSYPKHGSYSVKLWGTYHGKKKLLGNKKLIIQKAIEISDDAYVEVEE